MEDLPSDRPMKYIVDLEGCLNDNGGLKDEGCLKDFLEFMKKASKMAPRILLLFILNATDKKLQSKFCFSFGWNLLTSWLQEAKEETNDSFIRELLTVMKGLPVNVNVLKSNSCAKTVKQLSRINPEVSSEVPKLAQDVVSKWMSIINESFENKPKEKEAHTDKKKSRHDGSGGEEPPLKKRKKDKEKRRHDSSEGEINHLKKERRITSDGAKDGVTSPSIGKHSEKLSEKLHGDKHEKHASRKREREESPDTKQRKRATVKILPQRMRTAGIEEGGEKTVVTKSRSEVLAAKKEKLERTSADSGSAPSIESMHQKIKVSVSGSDNDAPEPRTGAHSPSSATPTGNGNAKIRRLSHEIHESNSFMNALNAASGPAVVRKKKKTNSSPSSLGKAKHETTNAGGKTESKQNSTVTQEKGDKDKDKDKDKEKSRNEEDAQSDVSSDSQGPKKSALAEIGSLITKSSSSRKSVRWADEDNLREIYYFELDETERVNVNRVISMEEMKRKEHLLERQNISRSLSTGNQSLGLGSESSPSSPYEKGWYRPMGLEGASCTTEFGKNSREVAIQAERERHVLAALYFTKEDIPPSAKEPDTAHEDYVEPVIIPLEDQTIMESDQLGGNHVEQSEEKHGDKTEMSGSPKNGGTGKNSNVLIAKDEKISLIPEVASLLKSLTANLSDAKQETNDDVENKEGDGVSKKVSEPVKGGLLPTPKQAMQPKPQQSRYSDDVWRLLRENYPHLNLDETISVERMRQLLEPIQEQLRACGALNNTGGPNSSPPSFQHPNLYNNGPPRPNQAGHQNQAPPRPMHPGSYGPGPGPNSHLPRHPPPQRPHGPSHPHSQQRPPFHNFANQGPRGYSQPPHTSHRPPFGGSGGPPHHGSNGPNGTSGGGYRGGNICRFYQNGTCRSGSNCRFIHSKSGGPPLSPQDV